MSRHSEQGNVPAFVIIGILLTAALIGVVIVVRNLQHTGDKIADSPKTSTQTTNDTKDTSTSPSTDKSSDANDQALKDALSAQSSTNKSNSSKNSGATQSSETPTSSTGSTAAANALPKTGPESTFISVVGATLLVGTGLAYMRSRRLV